MSGHSHWSSIKYRKGAADAKKGKLFSKAARDIMSAARQGGGDPEMNLKLKYAIEKAKAISMPKDNIERAIKKGIGELPGEQLEEVVYEGYGPGGIAVMMEILTDNRNRTAAEIRKIFEINGGNLGQSGCVSWMFDKKGLIIIEQDDADEETVMEIALDSGAEDMQTVNGQYHITCTVQDIDALKNALIENNIEIRAAEISQIPKTNIELDPSTARKAIRLMEALDDHDDIQNVYSNFNISEELLATIDDQ